MALMVAYNKETVQDAMDGRWLDFMRSQLDLKRSGKGYIALCPFHSEKNPSFNFNPDSGFYHCFGCAAGGDVFTFLMKRDGASFPEALSIVGQWAGVSAETGGRATTATYPYLDEQSNVLYRVVRTEPKGFFQQRPNGEGGWINGIQGVRRVLFQLPDVLEARAAGLVIHIAEGEKDCLTLRERGLPATCNVAGAGKWDASYSEALRGACVVILPDDDAAGRGHAQAVAVSLYGIAKWVRVVALPDLPNKGDISDWFSMGGTVEQLKQLVHDTPLWTPTAAPTTVANTGSITAPKAHYPPPPHEAAFYGLAGEFVRRWSPHTEADPVALMIQFLVAFGSVIGRCAHFRAEADDHFGNLFVVIVGQSSKARKGTSWGYIKQLFQKVASLWAEMNLVSGLSSGEGLIHAVRDCVEREGKDKDTGEPFTIVVDEGVEDKRLLSQESEFAAVLRVASRDGNTVSAILRNFWDSGNAMTLTKKEPTRATGAHVSVVGHITRDELRHDMTSTDAANGFGNRFLWFFARRSKELPEGGNLDEASLSPLVSRLKEAIDFASVTGLMKRDEQARELWCHVYHDLSAGGPGLAGAVTSRAEAQVMRLAMLYALLDCSPDIRREHLLAALALWEYSEASAQYIFGDSMGDTVADAILDRLRDTPEGLSRTDIRDLFQKNQTSARIEQALALLKEFGRARCERVATGGKAAERWHAVTATEEVTPALAPEDAP